MFAPLKEIAEFASLSLTILAFAIVVVISTSEDPSKLTAPLTAPDKAISLAVAKALADCALVLIVAGKDRVISSSTVATLT